MSDGRRIVGAAHPGATPTDDEIRRFLSEDVGKQDLTAALLPEKAQARALVIVREPAVLCGTFWFEAVFWALDPKVRIEWKAKDGDLLQADRCICELEGEAFALMTGERTALNLLQTLSGTATLSSFYAEKVKGSGLKVLDTRKTLPGLRLAQKYAVHIGGCHNHRLGLFDAILIKENHIRALGSIGEAMESARRLAPPGVEIEIEVESLEELDQALKAGATKILIDNFTPEMRSEAVARSKGLARIEVSGNICLEDLAEIARSGVDFVSIGALTKNIRAIDFSMQVTIEDRT